MKIEVDLVWGQDLRQCFGMEPCPEVVDVFKDLDSSCFGEEAVVWGNYDCVMSCC
jgi:hypothetical protein